MSGDHQCVEVRRSLDRRSGGIRTEENPLQPQCPLGGKGRLGRLVPRPCAGRRAARAGLDRQLRREGPSLGFGRKRERKPGDRSLARGTDDQNPCVDGRRMPSALVHTHRRPSRRLPSGRGTFGAASALPNPARRQGVTTSNTDPQASRGARRDPQHSAQSQSKSGRTASRPSSIERATPSSACSAA